MDNAAQRAGEKFQFFRWNGILLCISSFECVPIPNIHLLRQCQMQIVIILIEIVMFATFPPCKLKKRKILYWRRIMI